MLVMLDLGPSGVPEVATAVLAVNELALAAWLVVKGFDRSVRRAPLTAGAG